MQIYFRLFCLVTSALISNPIHAADNKAKPATPPPVPTPAFLDVVTFSFHTDGENHKVVVVNSPTQLRVDETDDGFSVIYQPQSEHYTGLEHGNYTFWEFSWPEVRAAVETSKRYESHLQDLSNEGFSGNTEATPAAPTNAATASAGADNSGYVWRPTQEKKRISGLDCVRWTGDTLSGENVEVWCYGGPLPKVQAAMERLRAINEPMALVPIRTMVPAFVLPVYDGLVKGGVTPILIAWGNDQDKNRFSFAKAGTRNYAADLFTVPKLYMKTTLVTMDGILNQKK